MYSKRGAFFPFFLLQAYTQIIQFSNYLDVASNYDITISRDIFDVFLALFLKMIREKLPPSCLPACLFSLATLQRAMLLYNNILFALMRIISFNFALFLSLHFHAPFCLKSEQSIGEQRRLLPLRRNDLLAQSSTETLLEMLKSHAGIKDCSEETVLHINGVCIYHSLFIRFSYVFK